MTYPWPYSLPPNIQQQPQPTQPHWIPYPPQHPPQPYPTLPPVPPHHPAPHFYPHPTTFPPQTQFPPHSHYIHAAHTTLSTTNATLPSTTFTYRTAAHHFGSRSAHATTTITTTTHSSDNSATNSAIHLGSTTFQPWHHSHTHNLPGSTRQHTKHSNSSGTCSTSIFNTANISSHHYRINHSTGHYNTHYTTHQSNATRNSRTHSPTDALCRTHTQHHTRHMA